MAAFTTFMFIVFLSFFVKGTEAVTDEQFQVGSIADNFILHALIIFPIIFCFPPQLSQ